MRSVNPAGTVRVDASIVGDRSYAHCIRRDDLAAATDFAKGPQHPFGRAFQRARLQEVAAHAPLWVDPGGGGGVSGSLSGGRRVGG